MSVCPRCSAHLRSERIGAVLVDGCDACGGLWFDANELAQLARGGRESVSEAEQAFEPPAATEGMPPGKMQCPKCSVALYEFSFKHTPEVKLDACPECRGMWADDRELDAIADRTAPDERPADERPTLRLRTRRTIAFVQRTPCRKCSEENYANSLVCWACGTPLHGRRGAMLCPRCDDLLYDRPADISGLDLDTSPRVDHCQGCGGIWLDIEAMSALMDLPLNWLQTWQESLSDLVRGDVTTREVEILCPACHVALDERTYAADSSVYLDRCTSCRGTWLDQGELVVIRRISMEQDAWGDSP